MVVLVAGLGLVASNSQLSAQDLGGDWDWGAVEQMDDSPVTRQSASTAKSSSTAVDAAAVAAPLENARPDFSAPPRPAYPLFAGMPPFEVIPSQRRVELHPCSNCHQWVLSNPEPRKLQAPHDDIDLQHGLHGKGKFWCFTCHDPQNGTGLRTLEGVPVEYGDAYIVCSQCHSRQAYDWSRGAHGKRISGWQGERQVLSCTACHYQHRPAFKPREPMSGPRMRAGLPRPDHWVSEAQRDSGEPHHGMEWQRGIDTQAEADAIVPADIKTTDEQPAADDEAS